MEEPELLGVGEDRLLLLHALGLAVLLVDVLQTRDGRVVLDEAYAGRERDDDRDVEEEVAFATLLARRERAANKRSQWLLESRNSKERTS